MLTIFIFLCILSGNQYELESDMGKSDEVSAGLDEYGYPPWQLFIQFFILCVYWIGGVLMFYFMGCLEFLGLKYVPCAPGMQN